MKIKIKDQIFSSRITNCYEILHLLLVHLFARTVRGLAAPSAWGWWIAVIRTSFRPDAQPGRHLGDDPTAAKTSADESHWLRSSLKRTGKK